MKSNYSIALKFLLISACIVCLIVVSMFSLAVYQAGFPPASDILIYLIISLFPIHSFAIIRLISFYSPPRTIPTFLLIIFWVSTIGLWLVDIFLFFAWANQHFAVNFRDIFISFERSLLFLSFITVITFQFYNSFAGIRLINRIIKNYRKDLLESF